MFNNIQKLMILVVIIVFCLISYTNAKADKKTSENIINDIKSKVETELTENEINDNKNESKKINKKSKTNSNAIKDNKIELEKKIFNVIRKMISGDKNIIKLLNIDEYNNYIGIIDSYANEYSTSAFNFVINAKNKLYPNKKNRLLECLFSGLDNLDQKIRISILNYLKNYINTCKDKNDITKIKKHIEFVIKSKKETVVEVQNELKALIEIINSLKKTDNFTYNDVNMLKKISKEKFDELFNLKDNDNILMNKIINDVQNINMKDISSIKHLSQMFINGLQNQNISVKLLCIKSLNQIKNQIKTLKDRKAIVLNKLIEKKIYEQMKFSNSNDLSKGNEYTILLESIINNK